MLRVLSLGAGVQSTTLALMAAHGEIGPMPDCAIFADTGWEPRAVYDHLRWLSSGNVLPFPVHVVSNGNIRTDIIDRADGRRREGRRPTPPYFVKGADSYGLLFRGCTEHYKLVPIYRHLRSVVGIRDRSPGPKAPVAEVWMGISTDEAMRVRPAKFRWVTNRNPLIEKRMSRWDCLRWIERNGYPQPPKSSCIGCPYHSDEQWRRIRDHAPDEWADAIRIDRTIREGFGANNGAVFTHRSCVPLDAVDLSTHAERGQPDLFNNECEGMCGV